MKQRRYLQDANFIGTVHHGLPESLLYPDESEPEYAAFVSPRVDVTYGPDGFKSE
jgi:hypothetical protein